MKTILATVALFVAGAVAQNSFSINTPSNVVECEPTLLSWVGGTGDILPGSSPNGAAIESFPATNSSSLTWQCNIASGTSIGFTLRDSTGQVAQTAPVNVNAGSSNSCLNTTSVAPGPTVASTPGGATTAGASATTGAAAGTSAAASPSATSGKSGASTNPAQLGAAGLVGAAVAALLL